LSYGRHNPHIVRNITASGPVCKKVYRSEKARSNPVFQRALLILIRRLSVLLTQQPPFAKNPDVTNVHDAGTIEVPLFAVVVRDALFRHKAVSY